MLLNHFILFLKKEGREGGREGREGGRGGKEGGREGKEWWRMMGGRALLWQPYLFLPLVVRFLPSSPLLCAVAKHTYTHKQTNREREENISLSLPSFSVLVRTTDWIGDSFSSVLQQLARSFLGVGVRRDGREGGNSEERECAM